jgi:hypothetical protein
MAYEKLFMHNQSDEKSIKWASPLIYGRPHAIAERAALTNVYILIVRITFLLVVMLQFLCIQLSVY